MKQYQIGLTTLYNNIHDPKSNLPVEELRGLHEQLDMAVAKAYGWDDLDMRHDFYRVEYLDKKDNLRHTIAEPVRLEVLRRLTMLNKQRWEEEQHRTAAAPAKPKTKKAAPASQQGSLI